MQASLYNEELKQTSIEARIQGAETLDKAVSEQGASSIASAVQDQDSYTYFANSQGLEAWYKSNSVYAYSYSICVQGEKRGPRFCSSQPLAVIKT